MRPVKWGGERHETSASAIFATRSALGRAADRKGAGELSNEAGALAGGLRRRRPRRHGRALDGAMVIGAAAPAGRCRKSGRWGQQYRRRGGYEIAAGWLHAPLRYDL